MGEAPKREWMESVQLVFDYFCERTPRSFVEARDTSVVWNYKYAGELGRLKWPDALQKPSPGVWFFNAGQRSHSRLQWILNLRQPK